MDPQRLRYAITNRQHCRPYNPFSQTRCLPPEKRICIFNRWQRTRKKYLKRLGLICTDADPQTTCACGSCKDRSMEMCYECRDAWTIVRHRFPQVSVHNHNTEKRYAMEPLRIYATPGPLLKSVKFIEDPNGAHENAVRAMEGD